MIEQYYSTHSGADIDATIELAKASKTRIDRNESAIGDLNNLNLRNDGHSLVTAVNTVNSGVEGGWVPFREYDSLKFGNANGPSFYCPSWELELGSSKSLTDYLSVGMKVKMTQNGIVKYFFITAMSENGVTLYGGTNYIVENTYIQSLYFSSVQSPYGFPIATVGLGEDFIIERGSNANGNYEKWNSGKLVMWGRFNNVPISFPYALPTTAFFYNVLEFTLPITPITVTKSFVNVYGSGVSWGTRALAQENNNKFLYTVIQYGAETRGHFVDWEVKGTWK